MLMGYVNTIPFESYKLCKDYPSYYIHFLVVVVLG